MGSTATDDVPEKKAGDGEPDNGNAGTVVKAASRKSPAGNKADGGKTASKNGPTARRSTDKPARGAKQLAENPRKKAPSPAQETERPARTAPQTASRAASADTTSEAGEDSRSISWMSAQAVSALNAVKASQARKAESLLARVEKPVPGKPGITELPVQSSEDLLEELVDMERTASLETATTSRASAGDIPTNQKEAPVMQDKPGEQEPMVAGAEATATPPTTESPASEETANTEAVVATAQAQRRGLPARPIVMAVFLAMLAYSGYRYWQDNRDSLVTAPPVAGSPGESTQAAGWDDIPHQEAIAVVSEKSGEPSATTITAIETETEVTTPDDSPEFTGIAPPSATQDTGAAAAATSWAPDRGTAQTAADVEPLPTSQHEIRTPAPAETATSEPVQAEATAVTAPPAPAVQPQPRYGAPGYGYYPQQPHWQQPYYQPAYPPQYPAR